MPNIRPAAAAQYLGLSKSWLDKTRCYGGGPVYVKLGRSVIYRTDDLDSWLAERLRTDNDNTACARVA